MAKKKNVTTANSQKHEILAPRLKDIPETELNERQRAMLNDIRTTRGAGTTGGPFGVFLHAPDYGDLAQKLGAHCRYRTAVPPHLSEFAILAIARLWRAQYEWHAHVPVAAKAGVRPETIRALKAGRTPARLSKDERAVFDFIGELHRTRRASERTYARLAELAHAVLAAGYPLIVDAAFLKRAQRERFAALARDTGARFLIAACSAAPATLRARVAARARAGQDASDAGLAVLEHQFSTVEPPAPDEAEHTLSIATEQGFAAPEAAALAQRLGLRGKAD